MNTSLKSIYLVQIIFLLVLCVNLTHQTNNHNAGNGIKDTSYFFYQRPEYPRDCEEVLQQCSSSQNISGVYFIKPDGFAEAFEVFCDHSDDSGGWTVIQRRVDGSLNFNRDWNEYKEGFGFFNSEFWLGYEKLSFMLNQKKYELRIQLVTSEEPFWHLSYDNFRISDDWGNYSLVSVGMYNGNADNYMDNYEDQSTRALSDNYIGCYEDQSTRALSGDTYSDSSGMTIQTCIDFCRELNHPYAGLQYGSYCFCGDNNYAVYNVKSDGECSTRCSGNSELYCGGSWRNSVYSVYK